ncbi:MAG TPA: cysteine desulfurase family protein [Gammaproteobacteria bacterium]|jgi:cysteine desulfurase|nr:cysteine desulfurase family protein [Gammaproteobacteria bacterium]
MSIYLDHNATAPLDVRVLETVHPWLTGVHGNPASVHRYGRAAHAALETARAQVAALVNAQPAQVVFTGGGTEADNLALKGLCSGAPTGRLLVGAMEHSAVLGPAAALAKLGWQVEYIPADGEGCYDLEALQKMSKQGQARLLSVMLANNETGAIQDVQTMATLAHEAGTILHCDAVQAAGKLPVDFAALGADLMTLSAHKLNGPRGVGALIMNRRVSLTPLVDGGGQEQGLRGGTENLAGIVGFGRAAELAKAELHERISHARAQRDRLETGLRDLPGLKIFAAGAERLPNTVQFGIPGLDGEWLVMELDKRGIAVSSGSACHSASGEPSHVLMAMGLDTATAKGALRVSFGAGNTGQDADAVCAALKEIVSTLGKRVAAVGW